MRGLKGVSEEVYTNTMFLQILMKVYAILFFQRETICEFQFAFQKPFFIEEGICS